MGLVRPPARRMGGAQAGVGRQGKGVGGPCRVGGGMRACGGGPRQQDRRGAGKKGRGCARTRRGRGAAIAAASATTAARAAARKFTAAVPWLATWPPRPPAPLPPACDRAAAARRPCGSACGPFHGRDPSSTRRSSATSRTRPRTCGTARASRGPSRPRPCGAPSPRPRAPNGGRAFSGRQGSGACSRASARACPWFGRQPSSTSGCRASCRPRTARRTRGTRPSRRARGRGLSGRGGPCASSCGTRPSSTGRRGSASGMSCRTPCTARGAFGPPPLRPLPCTGRSSAAWRAGSPQGRGRTAGRRPSFATPRGWKGAIRWNAGRERAAGGTRAEPRPAAYLPHSLFLPPAPRRDAIAPVRCMGAAVAGYGAATATAMTAAAPVPPPPPNARAGRKA